MGGGAARASRAWRSGAVLGLCAALAQPVAAQHADLLEGAPLAEALRAGGYVLYFRHAATDWSGTDRVRAAGEWTSCDPARMRQLSPDGRATARAIGAALRALGIPVGRVLASPYCRTVETARALALGPVETTSDLMNLRVADYFGGADAVAARTRRRLAQPPPPGTNAVLVAHGNVIRHATGEYPGEAGTVVFRPTGDGRFRVTARLAPEDWTRLAAQAPAGR
jgi:broad specificity phosphatase PhoE